jgi:hypothetical protein
MKPARWPHLVSLALVGGSVALWAATGREAFTRWRDARLEAADAPVSKSEEDLLDEIGMEADAETAPPAIESRFALGLLPSGGDPKHIASVAAALLAALAISGTSIVRARLQRGRQRQSLVS